MGVGSWELRILGPLEVRFAGRSVPVGGARQRSVLAVLLLCRGRMVPTTSLVDGVWEGREPASAVNTLQSYVSRLRSRFSSPVEGRADAPAIRGEAGGYRLDVDEEQLDGARFERLLAAGREELAGGDVQTSCSLFSTALELWRGPMLGDLNGAVAFRAETARMEDLRISAVELMAEAEIALGSLDQAIARLREVAAAHPLREGPVARLMRAMYHSGRQADALALYGDTRQRFVDELGIEPGAELSELQLAILRRERIPGFGLATSPADRRRPTGERRYGQTAGCVPAGTVGRVSLPDGSQGHGAAGVSGVRVAVGTAGVDAAADAVGASEGSPQPHRLAPHLPDQPPAVTVRQKPVSGTARGNSVSEKAHRKRAGVPPTAQRGSGVGGPAALAPQEPLVLAVARRADSAPSAIAPNPPGAAVGVRALRGSSVPVGADVSRSLRRPEPDPCSLTATDLPPDPGLGRENRERVRQRLGGPWGRPSADPAPRPQGGRMLGCVYLDPSAGGRDDDEVAF